MGERHVRIEISDFVIRTFVPRFHISSALKAANAYKQKGFPVIEIFQYLFLLIFSNRSMYMNLITVRNTPAFAKDTVYRFMKMTQINWMRFTTIVASRIIKTAIEPLTGEDRTNVLILDDSLFERSRSKKVELLAKTYDHAKHRFCFGFRMLTLGWSDGNTFLPINSVLLSIEVFFKVCKSYLKLSKECHSLSYDAMTAHTAVVFTRYMMLSLESRESNDIRSLGELFVYISDEMADVTWLQALQMLLQLFRSTLSETAELTEEKINELVDNFLDTLPSLLKNLLCAA